MTQRKGLGRGLGMGYKNLVQRDPYIHSLSAKGLKLYSKYVVGNKVIEASSEDQAIKKFWKMSDEKKLREKVLERKRWKKSIDMEKKRQEFEQLIRDDEDFKETWAEKDGSYKESSFKEWSKNYLDAKGTRLNAIGKVWSKVVEDTLPHETRVRGKIANTLRDDEIETILGTMDFFGASEPVMRQAYSDMKIARFRVGDWLGMFIQNEGYDKAGGETATKVLAHAYIKADGNIDKMIEDLRVTDYQVDTSWEKIDLRELH